MRAIVFSVVLAASPALAQTSATPASTPQDAPVSTAPVAIPAPEAAQVPPALDPLADLISQSSQTTDEEEVEAASKPAPRHKGTILPIPPPEPETSATPGAELTKAQIYELRVKGSIAAAQTLQGPMDGGWRVAGADGAPLYALQIVDKAGGSGELEGAWRDLRRPGAVGSTGLIEDLRREGDAVVARFSPRPGESSVLTLRSAGQDRWSGELVETGANVAVVAQHLLPEAPPGYETERRGPYVWPSAQRVAVSRPAAAPACSTKGKKGKALKAAKAKCAAAARKSKGSAVKKGKGGKAKATAARRGKSTVSKKKKKR